MTSPSTPAPPGQPASLLAPEWSGRNVRCSCGAVHYDMNSESVWTCPECGATHCPLATQECPLCGCTGYMTGGGCADCYCHEDYPGGCAVCDGRADHVVVGRGAADGGDPR